VDLVGRNENKSAPEEDRNGGFSERRAAPHLPDLCTSLFAAAPATPDVTDRTTGTRSKVGDPGTPCGSASRSPPSHEHCERLTCPAKTMWIQMCRCSSSPPWRQPRGNWVVSSVNSHTNATSKRWHMWEIDLRFALNSTPGRQDLHLTRPAPAGSRHRVASVLRACQVPGVGWRAQG